MQSPLTLALATGAGALAGTVAGVLLGTVLAASPPAPAPVSATAAEVAPPGSAEVGQLTAAMAELGRNVAALSEQMGRGAASAGRSPAATDTADLGAQLSELVALLRERRGVGPAGAATTTPLRVPAAGLRPAPLPAKEAMDRKELFRKHALLDYQQVLDLYGLPGYVGGEPKTQWIYWREDGSTLNFHFAGGFVSSVEDG